MLAHKITDEFEQKLLSSIGSSEDVLFYWSMLSADADEDDAKTLLKMVIEHNLWFCICQLLDWTSLQENTPEIDRNVQDSSSPTD